MFHPVPSRPRPATTLPTRSFHCRIRGAAKRGTDGIVAQVAVEEAMACGVGICMTCVMPVADAHGTTKMVRSCLEGPVFRGDRVRWEAFEDGLCRVPADAVGAPQEARR